MRSIGCPDRQSLRPEFSLPEIVTAVPGAMTPPGFLWIVRLVCTNVVAAEAVPNERTQTASSRDAAATFRLRRSMDFLMRLMRDDPESDPITERRGTQAGDASPLPR